MAKQSKRVNFINLWECQAWASKNYQQVFCLFQKWWSSDSKGFKRLWLWGYENVLEGFIWAGIMVCHRWWTFQVREKFVALKPPEGFNSEGVVVWYNLTVRLRGSDDITNTKQSKQRTRKCIQEIHSHSDCMEQKIKFNFCDFKNESDNHILFTG